MVAREEGDLGEHGQERVHVRRQQRRVQLAGARPVSLDLSLDSNNLTALNREGVRQHAIRMRYAIASGVVGDEERLFVGLDSPNGGRIGAESSPGAGSRFSYTVPIAG